ncbi:MAG: CRISPR-associated helicase Cas3' [Proteobacteria bacterium]|nr:CRISPR-associated helicase Cas3' [Pseudomonadota bacterium]MBU2469578.1 CRISPR-associated helicase Cas3' [Pseudomonadota bacterium]MBU2519591.1 CRISPR-associated helicase Cas3' [Pseudomonadota bacterium]
MRAYWQYWAKGGSATNQSSVVCHLLPFHLIDVAAVGRELISQDHILRIRLCRLLAVDSPALNDLVTLFLALHDIGKFADSFQKGLPELYRRLLGRSRSKPQQIRHSDLGYLLWQEHLIQQIQHGLPQGEGVGVPDFWDVEELLTPLARAAMGHHGQPPTEANGLSVSLNDSFFPEDIEAAKAWLATLLNIAPLTWLPATLNGEVESDVATASWLLAGLVVLCDWLGSNTEFFPARDQPMDPMEYLANVAIPQARKALAATHAIPPPANVYEGAISLFPKLQSLTPLQQEADTWVPSDKPQLFIIEDATGAGKTEAALTLAHKLMASGAGEGLFFALPTMATSNAMYGRLAEVYRRLFAPESDPSLVLAHSSSRLHSGFLESWRGAAMDAASPDGEGAAYCSAWLADNRKKALLAPVGVGTIDQALMGVLPSRHQSLRLLGLGRNVLVVDEVHAYDPYMHQLLCNLLKFHAAFGGSAVLLSASLPQKMRQELLNAFRQGSNHGPCEVNQARYPLLTVASETDVREVPVASWEQSRREVRVEFVHREEEVRVRLLEAARKGQCACWIRNTVSEAMEAWEELSHDLPDDELLLFHARFPLCDRLAREAEVVSLFGKQSTVADRTGKVLVATQVVEQSLDLDFDVLVSDLAPVDLLIQRAGRLHRHPRGDRGRPALAVHSPPFAADPAADWFSAQFPKAAYVYPDHGRLWLTAMLLREAGAIRVPGGVRDLIEGVYGQGSDGRIPEGLRASTGKAVGRDMSHLSLAQYNQLNLEDGYSDNGDKWMPDTQTPTRLGESTTILCLAKWDGVELVPWCGHDDSRFAWALSQVSVASHWVAGPAKHPPELALAVEAAQAQMLDQGRWSVLVPLEQDEEGGVWRGKALNQQGGLVQVLCGEARGLAISKKSMI